MQKFEHNGIEFTAMVTALVKPGQAIIDSLTPERADALHMAVGIAGEAGELLDAIKKYVVYNKPLDRDNVVEELGDLEFYMERLRQILGITREETMAATIDKLGKRYANGYSDQAAQARADKNEDVVIDVEMKEVKPTPPSELKYGDTVRMLIDHPRCPEYYQKGMIGTVECPVDGHYFWVDFGEGRSYRYICMDAEDQLVKIECQHPDNVQDEACEGCMAL